MINNNEIVGIIFNSIDDLNQENNINIIKDRTTKLFGTDGELDSILLVNLIVSIEESIEEKTGKYVPIADERAFSLEQSPFKNIETLANHIETLLNE